MKVKCILFVFLALFLLYALPVYSITDTDSLLNELSRAIENSDSYVKKKKERIKGLRGKLSGEDISLVERFNIYSDLYHEYRSFKFDSAFAYALKLHKTALQLDDPARITYSKLKLSFTLLSSGMFKEAFDSLNSVDLTAIPKHLKIDYYELMSRAYYDLAGYNLDTYYAKRYIEKGNKYADSAIALTGKNTQRFYYLRGMKNMKEGDFEEAKSDFKLILDNFSRSSHKYAIIASSLASVYKVTGETDKAIDLMIKAAIADIKSSTTEALALINLADLLYSTGDIGRAYAYIKQALEDAEFYGARQRKVQISAILPIIEGERLAKVESQRRRLFVYVIAVSLLSVLVFIFAFIIFRQFRHLREARRSVNEMNLNLHVTNDKLKETNNMLQVTNEKLLEANKIKEEYIGYSFNMYIEYIEKIENLKKRIHRKLMARRYDEIRNVMGSVNLRKEREALYLSFDKIFLKLFPNFISDFNAYFKEDDKFILKDTQTLNIELRIFALIRIGINDHEQIANILEYSVRTIYNYKTKVKNKSSLSNEEFERKMMDIKAF